MKDWQIIPLLFLLETRDEINADYSMLYDLEKDPNEFNNLIDDPDYSEIKKELNEKLSSAINGSEIPRWE